MKKSYYFLITLYLGLILISCPSWAASNSFNIELTPSGQVVLNVGIGDEEQGDNSIITLRVVDRDHRDILVSQGVMEGVSKSFGPYNFPQGNYTAYVGIGGAVLEKTFTIDENQNSSEIPGESDLPDAPENMPTPNNGENHHSTKKEPAVIPAPGSLTDVPVTTPLENSPSIPGDDTNVSFADISSHWARGEIEFMASQGIVRGMGDDQFKPDLPVSRAQFTAMLVSLLKPSGERVLPFEDVAADQWYFHSVSLAYSAGLIQGVRADAFAPNDVITREQLVAMLAGAMRYQGLAPEISNIEQILARFTDQADISSWARLSAAQAVAQGIIKGKSSGQSVNLAPRDPATRAEAIVMLKNLYELGKHSKA